MRNRMVVVAALVGLGAVAGCSSNDLVAVLNTSCSNLAGLFTATAMTATATADSTKVHNYLDNGGAFTLAFSNAGGTFASSFTQQTKQAPLVQTGAVTTSGNSITLGSNTLFVPGITGAQTFTCSLSTSALTLVDSAATFTFTGDTVPEPARIAITLSH